jgi:hypothetical protein
MKLRYYVLFALGLLLLTLPSQGRAQSYPPAWKSTSTYAVGDLVQENGNVYRAIKAVTIANQDPAKIFTDWELYDVRANTTLFIGPDETFTTFLAAWNYALNARISPAVYLHLYIYTGHGLANQSFSAPFSLDHPFGASMSILGDNPSRITFTFSAQASNGVVIDTGHSFGSISNITLSGPPAAIGITALQNASVGMITGVQYSGFALLIEADTGGSLTFAANTNLSDFISTACRALDGGVVTFGSGLSINGELVAGNGLVAMYGGQINAMNCSITGCDIGAQTHDFGRLVLDGSTIESKGTYGILGDTGGQVSIENGTVTGNGTDILAASGAVVDAFQSDVGSTSVGGSSNGSYIFIGSIGNP